MRTHPTVAFTREFIESARQEALSAQRKRVIFCNDPDYTLRGYMLIVSPRGAVRFVLSYKSPETGKPSSITLGSWPGMSDAEARRRVLAARGFINRGIDPRNRMATPNGPAGGDA